MSPRPRDSVSTDSDRSTSQSAVDNTDTGPGDVLSTVLPGLPIGGYLPLWHDDGQLSFWRLATPKVVRSNLGIGALARAEVDVCRYRDACMFNRATNEIFLMSRTHGANGVNAVCVDVFPATEREADEAATEDALSDLYNWLGDIIVAAARRREFVAVESGGWDVSFEPYALALVQSSKDGLRVTIETSPTPTDAPIWRDQEAIDPNGQTIIAPASEETLHAAGYLIGCALSTWSVPVTRLGLSFGPDPAGGGQ